MWNSIFAAEKTLSFQQQRRRFLFFFFCYFLEFPLSLCKVAIGL